MRAGFRAEIGGALSRAGAAHKATPGKDVHSKARTLGQLSLLGQMVRAEYANAKVAV